MKTALTLKSNKKDMNFLPIDLQDFFYHINNGDSYMLGKIPMEFFVDHPYRWTLSDKMGVLFRLRNLIRVDKELKDAMEKYLVAGDLYDSWNSVLTGPYLKVYNKSLALRSGVKYKKRFDLLLYFVAAFTHVNEPKYAASREFKKFGDDQIERDLINYYSTFYINIFGGLCTCRSDTQFVNTIPAAIVEKLSTMFHPGSELRRGSTGGMRTFDEEDCRSYTKNVMEGTSGGASYLMPEAPYSVVLPEPGNSVCSKFMSCGCLRWELQEETLLHVKILHS